VKVILLTNDDGIEAEGLRTLEEALKGLAHLIVVAPDQERSAVSHGLTLHSPLSAKEIKKTKLGEKSRCYLLKTRILMDCLFGLLLNNQK
jgi:5'-nucleotidase